MNSPFPGMDPWLEDTALWSGFHATFLVYLRDALRPRISPRYIASVEDRVYIQNAFDERTIKPDLWIRGRRSARPHGEGGTATATLEPPSAAMVVRLAQEEIREQYLDILDRETGMSVITTLELLSPTNKEPGPGRDSYLKKQAETLASATHLVEMDFLRGGMTTVYQEGKVGLRNHVGVVLVHRASPPRDTLVYYPVKLRESLPTVLIPLAGPEDGVTINLQRVFDQTYDAGEYGERIRYDRPCKPPLLPEDAAWAEELLRARGQAAETPGG